MPNPEFLKKISPVFSLPDPRGSPDLLPRKLVHEIGRPIPITREKGESAARQLNRIHREVLDAMTALAKKSI